METKPGHQTTEFAAMIVAVLLPWLVTLGDNTDVINVTPEKWRWILPVIASVATAFATGFYAVGRGKAKQGIPYDPTKAGS